MVLSAMMIGLRLDNQNGMRETGRTHGSQWSSEKCHGCYFAPSSWTLALSSRPASHQQSVAAAAHLIIGASIRVTLALQ